MTTKMTLQVYVSDECWTCQETERIVRDIAHQFPNILIEIREMGENQPDEVFAVPTYLLNGRTIYLGNPTREELKQTLINATHAVGI